MNYLEFFGSFNLNGEAVQVCKLDTASRELWVYNHFYKHASECSKYYAKKHGMTENECTCYIASGMYNKFLSLRSKTIKKCGHYFNAVEVCCYYRVMSQLKIAIQKMNTVTTCEYKTIKAWASPSVDISIQTNTGLKTTHIPVIYHNEKHFKDFNPVVNNPKMFDIVDVIEVWDNRHSRTESRLRDAMNELNGEIGNKTFFSPYNVDNLSDEDKKRLNKKLNAISRYNNMLDRMTKLSGNYSNPLDIYCHNETLQEAREKLASDKRYKDILAMCSTVDNLSTRQRDTLRNFRERHNLYYCAIDDSGNEFKHEPITLDNLVYLCK
jgi:hypothetical protein